MARAVVLAGDVSLKVAVVRTVVGFGHIDDDKDNNFLQASPPGAPVDEDVRSGGAAEALLLT